jgi:uncharacterized protein (DUF983 family)
MSTEASGNGIGLGSVLFVVFLVLKLVGVIDWSWWWVTSPLWIPLVLILGIFAIIALTGAVVTIVSHNKNINKWKKDF